MAGPYAYDRVKETTTTTGTGTLTLAGAVTGFRAFSVVGDGNSCHYCIDGGTGEWEVGIGTYTASGTTLSRTTILGSSNSGALVSFSAGTKNVFNDAPAALFDRVSYNVKSFGAYGDGKYRQTGSLTSGSSTLSMGASTPFAASDVGKFIFLQGGGTTRTVTDGAITTGTNVLTSATAAFTSADVGSHCQVAGAGAAGATLTSQIAAVTNGTTAQLNDRASTTVSGASTKVSGNLTTTIATFVDSSNVTLTSGNAPATLSGIHFVWGTNDDTAIAAAITAAAAVGVGGVVYFPVGMYVITSTVAVPLQATLQGTGSGSYVFNNSNVNMLTGSTLMWCGAKNGTILKVAPTSTGNPVIGVVIDGLLLHGNKGVADTGLRMEACVQCVVRNLSVKQTALRCIDLNTTTLGGFSNAVNFVDACAFDYLWMHPCAGGDGLYLDGAATGSVDVDPGFCTYSHLFINHENGVAINCVNTDNSIFTGVWISRVSSGTGGTGIGIELKGGGSDHRCARNLTFHHVVPGQGGLTARATGLLRPTYGHQILSYSTAAGAPLPTVEPGAGIAYALLDGTIYDNSIKPGSPVQLGGSIGLNTAASYGFHQLGGSSRLQAIGTPAAPTVALGGGSGSGTNRTYWVIAEDVNGNKSLASPPTTFSGPTTITAANWIKITWAGVAGAVKYYILRNTTTTLSANTLLTLTGTWTSANVATSAGQNQGNVASLNIVAGGSGYTNGTFTDGTFNANGFAGSGATFGYTIAGGIVTNLVVTNGGTSNGAPLPVLGASAGGGTGFSGTANVAIGTLVGGIFLEAHDTGQSANGTIAIPTRNATADATIDGNVILGAASAIGVGTMGVTTSSVSSTTTAETKSLIGTITGTFTCPANFMVVGRNVRLKLNGVITTGGTASTITYQVKFAGTVIASTGAIAPTISLSNMYWEAEIDMICRTAGASGTLFVQGKWSRMNATTAATTSLVTWPIRGNSADPPAVVTVDTTASSLIDFQSITGNNLHTITCNMATLEVLN